MDAKLVVIEGRVSKREVRLKLPTVIGRSRQADLTVNHSQVSREHCRIYEIEGALVVRDNDSTNGTYVEGRRIVECVLRPGDRLRIGPLTFSVVYEHQGDYPVLDITKRGDHDATVEGAIPLSVDTVQVESDPAAPPSRSSDDTVDQGALETIGRRDRFGEPPAAPQAADAPWPDFVEDDAAAGAVDAPSAGEDSTGNPPESHESANESAAAAEDEAPQVPDLNPTEPAPEAIAETQTWVPAPPSAGDEAALPPPASAVDEPAERETVESSEAEEPNPPSRPIIVERAAPRPGQPQAPRKGLFGWLPFGRKKPASKAPAPPKTAPPAPPVEPPPEEPPELEIEESPAEDAAAVPEDEPPVGSGDEGLDSFLRKLR